MVYTHPNNQPNEYYYQRLYLGRHQVPQYTSQRLPKNNKNHLKVFLFQKLMYTWNDSKIVRRVASSEDQDDPKHPQDGNKNAEGVDFQRRPDLNHFLRVWSKRIFTGDCVSPKCLVCFRTIWISTVFEKSWKDTFQSHSSKQLNIYCMIIKHEFSWFITPSGSYSCEGVPSDCYSYWVICISLVKIIDLDGR